MRWFTAFVVAIPCMAMGQSFTIVPGIVSPTASDSVIVSFKVMKDDKPVESLARDQVRVVENKQTIGEFVFDRTVLPNTEPTYAVMVLDASGSMKYGEKLASLRSSAGTIIDAMTGEDQCSIVAFSSKPRLLAGFTNDKKALKESIQSIKPGGYTAIYDAIWEAIRQLESQPESSPKVILLITDGREEGISLFGMADIVPRLQSVPNLTMHVFDLNRTRRVADLRRIAKLGSGSYFHDPEPEKVFKAFGEFLTENRKFFVFRYKAPSSAESRRAVTISVRMDGIEQKMERSYRAVPVQSSTVEGAVVLVGLFTACAAGVAGTVAFARRRKNRITQIGSTLRDPLLVEPSTSMMFDVGGLSEGEDKTHALILQPEENDEKTIIIENRKKEHPVFGRLIITDTNNAEKVIDIDSPELLFGRSAQCKAQFENMEVSRLHAKLRLETDGFILYDLGSANGTLVNGEEVQKRLLNEGDEIEIGRNRIVFHNVTGGREEGGNQAWSSER